MVCNRVYTDASDPSGPRLREVQRPAQSTSSATTVSPQRVRERAVRQNSSAPPANLGVSNPSATHPAQTFAPPAVPPTLFSFTPKFEATTIATATTTPPNFTFATPTPSQNPTIVALQKAINVLTVQLNATVSSTIPLDAERVAEISNALSASFTALEKAKKMFS